LIRFIRFDPLDHDSILPKRDQSISRQPCHLKFKSQPEGGCVKKITSKVHFRPSNKQQSNVRKTTVVTSVVIFRNSVSLLIVLHSINHWLSSKCRLKIEYYLHCNPPTSQRWTGGLPVLLATRKIKMMFRVIKLLPDDV
jgi:hypothetical protein